MPSLCSGWSVPLSCPCSGWSVFSPVYQRLSRNITPWSKVTSLHWGWSGCLRLQGSQPPISRPSHLQTSIQLVRWQESKEPTETWAPTYPPEPTGHEATPQSPSGTYFHSGALAAPQPGSRSQ